MAIKTAIMLATLMCTASVVAYVVKPSTRSEAIGAAIQLETAIPKQFGPWREEPARAMIVANPQTKALLEKLYSQTLERTYVDGSGYRVMLSMAYGDDQRGGLQAHMPEVCYPAQGFVLRGNRPAEIQTAYGRIAVKRLDTQLGNRVEPVTYWFAFADQVVTSRFEQRLAEIKFGLQGRVPHGLLMRVSSIDADGGHAYAQQDRFVNDLLAAVSEQDRARLTGSPRID